MNVTTEIVKSAKEIHENRMKLWDASIENHTRYLDKNTGLLAANYVEERPCPVCASRAQLKMFNKEGGTYVKCKDCEMVFINPVLTDDALNDYYSRNHDLQAEIVSEDNAFYTSIYQAGLQLVENALSENGIIFDFGCSSGMFLDVARKNGWEQTWGVELNKSEYKMAHEKGHQVYNELITEDTLPKKVDAITLWDVFEHLKDGAHFLKLFKNLLADDGLLFLQIPNSMGLAPRIMQGACNMFDGLEHVNLYGPKTIEKLAMDNGYDVVELRTVIPETHILENYLSYENPYLGEKNAASGFLDLLDDKKILDSLLGYKIQVVLKPRV